VVQPARRSAAAARYRRKVEGNGGRGLGAGVERDPLARAPLQLPSRRARRAFLEAKTYYSLARFPAPYHSGSAICPPDMSPLKAQSYNQYLECFRPATELSDMPHEVIRVARDGKQAVGFLRLPKGASASSRVPAVLVMCGADMYTEEREKYS